MRIIQDDVHQEEEGFEVVDSEGNTHYPQAQETTSHALPVMDF
jgi:hypothetical protein